ncbi:Putative hypothetical protein [Helicobacter mustelae 12198]|uniref:Uncharacterized protein n=1 Tax=Helicobacter mustelae (strain ATCC 43772 / CCUG 25715 / CIP 103759 / LMG 18044 / NCTC 12198 / R85-136P) TaxID=679897 RepID=D3UI77_HELM1|nr:Putative hypothetical protein [Helicobacter mustelae 12198]
MGFRAFWFALKPCEALKILTLKQALGLVLLAKKNFHLVAYVVGLENFLCPETRGLWLFVGKSKNFCYNSWS